MDIGGGAHQNTQPGETNTVDGATPPQGQQPIFGPSDLSTLNTVPRDGPSRPTGSDRPQTPVTYPSHFIKRIPVADLAGVAKIEETLDAKSRNWHNWSHSMHLMLDIVDAGKYVDGVVKQPDPQRDPISAENWQFNDTYIRVIIGRNIAQTEKCHILLRTTR